MPTYRYQFCDLLSDTHITDLPLTGVRYDRLIVKPGEFSATIPIPNRTAADAVARIIPRDQDDLSTGPGRVLCHVWRNGDLWGSYIIWTGRVSANDRGRLSASIRGESLESWLHRVFHQDGLFWTDEDQLHIARELVRLKQEQLSGGSLQMGIIGGGPATSGITRDRTYSNNDWATLGERLTQLSEVIDGPEWFIRTYPDANGNRVREFYVDQLLGDPNRLHHFAQPGAVLSWRHSVDATSTGTQYFARGGTTQPSGYRDYFGVFSQPHRDAGWAQLEELRDYPTVTVGDTLVEYSTWWATHRAGAQHGMEVTVRLGETPTLTPDRLGERARITLVNDWFPLDDQGQPTFDQTRRIIGMSISAPTRTSPEECRLILEGPRDDSDVTSRGRPEYAADLTNALDARAHSVARSVLSNSAPIT